MSDLESFVEHQRLQRQASQLRESEQQAAANVVPTAEQRRQDRMERIQANIRDFIRLVNERGIQPASFVLWSEVEKENYLDMLQPMRGMSTRAYNKHSSALHNKLSRQVPIRTGWKILDETSEYTQSADSMNEWTMDSGSYTVHTVAYITTASEFIHNFNRSVWDKNQGPADPSELMAKFLLDHE